MFISERFLPITYDSIEYHVVGTFLCAELACFFASATSNNKGGVGPQSDGSHDCVGHFLRSSRIELRAVKHSGVLCGKLARIMVFRCLELVEVSISVQLMTMA